MANPHKGEVSFAAGDETYTLRFSVDALCALEEQAGKGIIAISNELADVDRISMRMMRLVMWSGLREHHPNVDVKAAGELILQAGGVVAMMSIISKALEMAFPEKEEDGASRPPKAGQNGAGPRSTAPGAA